MTKGKVYVVQESPGKNILSATDYGEIVVLLPESRQLMFSAGAIVNELNMKMSKFCDDDYILLIGDPAAIGAACAVASRWNNGKVKMLKWDRQELKYFPVQISIYPERKETT